MLSPDLQRIQHIGTIAGRSKRQFSAMVGILKPLIVTRIISGLYPFVSFK